MPYRGIIDRVFRQQPFYLLTQQKSMPVYVFRAPPKNPVFVIASVAKQSRMQEYQSFAGLLRHFVPRNDGLIEVAFNKKDSITAII
jgi:hypothetical protein